LIVVDASVLAPALGDDGPGGDRKRERLGEGRLAAPAVVDLEVISAIRGALRGGRLEARRAQQALVDLMAIRIRRLPHGPLLPRIWALRDNLTPYDAAYVALAEAIGATLLTADRKLARAPGIDCEVELLA
jgi:predicted nucleic acid-binding protein